MQLVKKKQLKMSKEGKWLIKIGLDILVTYKKYNALNYC